MAVPAHPTSDPTNAPTIDRLPELLAALPAHERQRAERLFQVVATEGTLDPPEPMRPWIERTFGSVEATLRQRVVRVLNRWTFEGATFNALRARRPGAGTTAQASADPPELRERIARAQGDDFCEPEQRTPADSFGRVRGRHVVTASNVAKADGWHAVGIFDRHDPLAIDAALVADALAVTREWAEHARAEDPAARHLFLLWNCLWRAGASLIHGHIQMTLSHEMAHGRVELWRSAAARYARETGGDYFADLAAVHLALGLGVPAAPATAFAALVPMKERELVLLHPGGTERLEELAAPLAQAITGATETLGVRAFNVAIFGPPLGADAAAEWAGFPLVARFVDRGNPLSPTSDIAGLELFGSSVISADPFDVARALGGGRA